MKIKTTALSIHELGQRPNQEDNIYPDCGPEPFSSDLYILCDGMGGHSGGEVASSVISSGMAGYVREHYKTGDPFTEDMFQSALTYAHDILDTKDDGAVRKMGTTLTFLMMHAGGCFAAHMGDSRIYQIRPSAGSVVFRTRDHSLVNDLVTMGEITEDEAKDAPNKNVITRAIQAGQARRTKAECHNLTDIKPGDYFFMCSDGMLEEMDDCNIVNILSMEVPDEKKRDILLSRTGENKDNHSAHIIRVLSVEDLPSPDVKEEGVAAPVGAEPPKSAGAAPDSPAPPPRRPQRSAPVKSSSSTLVSILIGCAVALAVIIGGVIYLRSGKVAGAPDGNSPVEVEAPHPVTAPVATPRRGK